MTDNRHPEEDMDHYDEHVWAFRWYRFHLTGFMIGVVYSDGYHAIDPRDYFLSPPRS